MIQLEHLALIRRDLVSWFTSFQRDLPWRRTSDPYAIWLSEVMLQQTRVAAVIPYFHRFLARFPNVESLAVAPESELLAHWAGLGYYYRARNLQIAARVVLQSGSFPSSHDAILNLPGVGPYTAAAVASIAFNLPYAVLDGNVFRVLSRLYADSTNIASGPGKKHFTTLASDLLDRENPGVFNQAMMELGATVCLPKAPKCLLCPVSAYCQARLQNKTADLPVKQLNRKSIKQDRTLFWIESNQSILVWQRSPDSRLMPGFWELPETQHLPSLLSGDLLGSFKHGITVHSYRFLLLQASPPAVLGPCVWKSISELRSAPISTIFRKALRIVDNQQQNACVKTAASR